MVNVHRADDVTFEDVLFRDNVRSDDTFHAMHSRVRVLRCHFLRANSDALDMDIASGEIRDSRFELTGGDAIDLMTSTPRIINNRITGSGDKGISIGEASRPFVFNNVIDSCTIGIEVKDRSEPVILNNIVTHNRTGLRERRKNWRYGGGGWATVAATQFAGNRTPRARDVYSRLTLIGTAGLDSAGTATVVEPGDLGWLYASMGIVPEDTTTLGPLSRWHEAPAVAPIDRQRFVDDFGAVADGWVATGLVPRLEKRRDALVIEATRGGGTVARKVDWQLPAGGTLVLEYASRDLISLHLRVTGDSTIVAPIYTGTELATARVAILSLPPGHYTALGLELVPIPGLTRINAQTGLTELRGGRLDLRGYLVMPVPAPALAVQ
jgi:parallel beta-helix repeat protein